MERKFSPLTHELNTAEALFSHFLRTEGQPMVTRITSGLVKFSFVSARFFVHTHHSSISPEGYTAFYMDETNAAMSEILPWFDVEKFVVGDYAIGDQVVVVGDVWHKHGVIGTIVSIEEPIHDIGANLCLLVRAPTEDTPEGIEYWQRKDDVRPLNRNVKAGDTVIITEDVYSLLNSKAVFIHQGEKYIVDRVEPFRETTHNLRVRIQLEGDLFYWVGIDQVSVI